MQFSELRNLFATTAEEKLPSYAKLQASNLSIILESQTPTTILRIYENGVGIYAVKENGKIRKTVFTVQNVSLEYDFVTGCETLDESAYNTLDAALPLTLYAEERLIHNADSREEYRTAYHLDNDGNDFTMEAVTPDFSDWLIDGYEKKTTHKRLQEAIGKLTEKQKEVIAPYFFDGLTQDEIAKKLGLGRTTVQARLDGALKKLKKFF